MTVREMTETEKKLPKVLKIFIEMLGVIMGLSIGIIEFIIGLLMRDIYLAILLWASSIIGCLVFLQIIQWRHFDLLKEWGILKPKKKKEEKKTRGC